MKLTRKELLLGGAAGAALGAAGIYELVDRLADSPTHFGEGREPEQHLLDGMRIEDSEGVEIVIPTRHHQMVTAKIADSPGSLAEARAALSDVLQKLDGEYPGTPEGLAITVAWGLPYFHTHVPGAAELHLPSTGARTSAPSSTPGASRATRRTCASRTTTSRSSSGATTRSTSRRRRPRSSTG